MTFWEWTLPGATKLTLRYEQTQEVPVDQLRSTVQGLELGDSMIQNQTDLSTGTKSLSW